MNGSILSSVENSTMRADYLSQVKRKGLGLHQNYSHKIIFVDIAMLYYNLHLRKMPTASTHSPSVTSVLSKAFSSLPFHFPFHITNPCHTHWDHSKTSYPRGLQYFPFQKLNLPKTIITALTHLENFDAPLCLWHAQTQPRN